MINTSEYISLLREQTGLNNYQLAKTYGINQSNFNKYANGSAQLSVNHAFIVADALAIDASEVLVSTKIEKAQATNNENELQFWSKYRRTSSEPTPTKENIVIAQFSPIPCDIGTNTTNIISIIKKHRDADVLIFPELAICGYMPEDMLFHEGFMNSVENAIEQITKATDRTIVIFGCPTREELSVKTTPLSLTSSLTEGSSQSALYNSALMLHNGSVVSVYHKQCLPNHSVFDEKRYFHKGDGKPLIFSLNDRLYSVIICEDTWSQSVINYNINSNIDTIISINASPFSKTKYETRIDTFKELYADKLELIYVNSASVQDDLVFDGGSFVMNTRGEVTHRLSFFTQEVVSIAKNYLVPYDINAYNYNALVYSIKEYFNMSNCFDRIYIALSGGIDSALTLCLAVDAIGAENVYAVMMSYHFTTDESKDDAFMQAQMLGVNYKEVPIHSIVESYHVQGIALSGLALENIQARIRGNIIMGLANEHNGLVLTTSNKSESSVGYATLYGDMAGGFAPLKDVYKTDVYKLSKYRNSLSYSIPLNVLQKEPTAELREGQTDSQSLPSYDELDAILKLFVDEAMGYEQIISYGFRPEIVQRVIGLVKNSEFKRKQSPIGTKFSDKAFHRERRYPMINKYNFFS